MQLRTSSDEALIEDADAAHRRVCASHLELFRVIAEVDRREAWQGSGARDLAHWLWMRYGISDWKARRWIAAAHALEQLPAISKAISRGELGVDKVVEITRLATPETEATLISWAQGVSCGTIRHEADLAARPKLEDAGSEEETRRLAWWFHGETHRRFGMYLDMPAAHGAVVVKGIERVAAELPVLPGEEDPWFVEARRADALVALCSARISADADPDRATVVVHTRMDGLVAGGGSELEGGPVIHPQTARRLLCDARVETVLEDGRGTPLRISRLSREPSAQMLRQLRYRDRECRFPGCGARRFTQAHHIVWWRHGGRTDLENLVLICTFHHRLVHEYGWALERTEDGSVRWFWPDGTRYRAGPGPPGERIERQGERIERQSALLAAS